MLLMSLYQLMAIWLGALEYVEWDNSMLITFDCCYQPFMLTLNKFSKIRLDSVVFAVSSLGSHLPLGHPLCR